MTTVVQHAANDGDGSMRKLSVIEKPSVVVDKSDNNFARLILIYQIINQSPTLSRVIACALDGMIFLLKEVPRYIDHARDEVATLLRVRVSIASVIASNVATFAITYTASSAARALLSPALVPYAMAAVTASCAGAAALKLY